MIGGMVGQPALEEVTISSAADQQNRECNKVGDPASRRARGILVTATHTLSQEPGGQQLCTREFIETLQTAGISLESVSFDLANGWREKIGRRLDLRPYRWIIPRDLGARTLAAAERSGAEFIFLNTTDLAPLAIVLKASGTRAQIVLLSHGLASVDTLHQLRTQNWRSDFFGLTSIQVWHLGQLLIEECKHRMNLDAVLCLNEFEVSIEKWLGAERILVVPRVVRPALLDWKPVAGRTGFVGRLDHPPNLEGLVAVLGEIARRDIKGVEVRLVGSTEECGREIASRYPVATYVGALSDAELEREAATWTCTMNPILCYAMGASTKLAVLLGWGIPVVTTPQGQRGYEWRGATPIVRDTPHTITDAIVSIATNEAMRLQARAQILATVEQRLTIADMAERVRPFLLGGSIATETSLDEDRVGGAGCI
jgi:hypothetical protein